MEQEKAKKRPRRYGCLWILGILLMIPAVCYASMWLFARYGGEWATSKDLPVPPDSELMAVSYSNGYWMRKHSLFFHSDSAEDLRQWYVDQRIGMTPIPLDLEGNFVIDPDDYYSQGPLFHRTSDLQRFHTTFANYLTLSLFDEVSPMCQGIQIYKHNNVEIEYFSDILIPEGKTAFVVTTCWANVGY